MINRANKIIYLKTIFVIVGFFLLPINVFAITLSPTKQTVIMKPGKSELIKFEIKNDSETTKVMIPELEGFKIDEKTGRPIFGQRDDAISWITPAKNEIILKPGGKGSFTFSVRVPPDAITSGHYIALFAKEKNIGGQIAVSPRVGSLLFLYTEGKINEDLYLISFDYKKNKKDSVKLFLDLKNTGNIHLVPEGEITIRNWSKKILTKLNINELNRKVLPNGLWSGEYSIPLKYGISDTGLLYAEVDIQYGLTKQKIGATTSFWYFPIDALIYLFGLCFLLILIFLLTKKYLKK